MKTNLTTTALGAALAAALLCGAGGCASGPQIVNDWRDPQFKGPAFRKVAVVGITDRETNRRIFESAFVAKLQEKGVEAVPSYDVAPADTKMSREEIERLVADANVDAIITTRVVDRSRRTEFSAGAYPSHYRDYYGFYDYSWGYYHDPSYVYRYEVVSLETNVYETRDYRIVWSGTSETVDPASVEAESERLASRLVDRLLSIGLLAP